MLSNVQILCHCQRHVQKTFLEAPHTYSQAEPVRRCSVDSRNDLQPLDGPSIFSLLTLSKEIPYLMSLSTLLQVEPVYPRALLLLVLPVLLARPSASSSPVTRSSCPSIYSVDFVQRLSTNTRSFRPPQQILDMPITILC